MNTESKKQIGTNLGILARWPMIVLFLPAITNKYVMAAQASQANIEVYSFIALFVCYLLSFVQPEYRALYSSNLNFKIGSSLIYFCSIVPTLVLKLYFPNSNLAIFSELFLVFGVVVSIFYYGHFYQPKYFLDAGWVKSQELKAQEIAAKNSEKPSSVAAWVMVFIIFLVVLFVIWLK